VTAGAGVPAAASQRAVVDVVLYGYRLTSAQGSAGFCGIYLIRSGAETILFDVGHAGRRRALIASLARRGLDPGDISAVVVSHTHYDHVQNVDLFPRAVLCLHPAELAPQAGDLARPSWTRLLFRGRDVRAVGDGAELAPGVRVLHLPGHTAGSIGLVAGTGRGVAVCTGDALSTAAALRAGVPSVVGGDPAQARASLRRAAALADLIYPGHDAPYQVTGGLPGGYLSAAPPPFGG
jgi:glyoxylase-like metal-dependent hydrolase (beta-lactamase superfamily II)